MPERGWGGSGVARALNVSALVLAATAVAACRPTPTPLPDAAADYVRYCAVCHGRVGDPVEGTGAPRLNSPTLLAAASDDYLFQAIARGRPGTTMTAWSEAYRGPISDATIRSIMTYVRRWGTPGPPATEALPQLPSGDAARGRAEYVSRCALCHGSDGASPTAPDLANPVFQETASDDFIASTLRTGRPGTVMPAYAELPDQTVADILAAIRELGRTAAGGN